MTAVLATITLSIALEGRMHLHGEHHDARHCLWPHPFEPAHPQACLSVFALHLRTTVAALQHFMWA